LKLRWRAASSFVAARKKQDRRTPRRASTQRIDVVGFDGVSDNGQDIYNFFKQQGIINVALMGVAHEHRYSQPLQFVSHTRGTELVIEHIDAGWCPSILSNDLTRVIPGTDSLSGLSLRPHPRRLKSETHHIRADSQSFELIPIDRKGHRGRFIVAFSGTRPNVFRPANRLR
jgi:hypothetical protein